MICNASKFEVVRCQSAVDYDLRTLLCKSSSKEAFFFAETGSSTCSPLLLAATFGGGRRIRHVVGGSDCIS